MLNLRRLGAIRAFFYSEFAFFHSGIVYCHPKTFPPCHPERSRRVFAANQDASALLSMTAKAKIF